MIEVIDQAGRRAPLELCDSEPEAQLRALQLADAAGRIQARIDARDGLTPPARLSVTRAERLAEYPRLTIALPPGLAGWLVGECARRRLGLSDLVGRILGERMTRDLAGDDA